MRSTFVGFETARRGLMASQKAIDVTGNNLANINTPGYTRQRLDLVSINNFGASNQFATVQASKTGQGVGMLGVAQIRDKFLDKRFREEYCDVGYYDQMASALKDVENSLDERVNSGLKDALSNFMEAIQSLNNYSDQEENANIVLTSAKNMTQVLRVFSNKLDAIAGQQQFELDIAVKEVNSIFEELAQLNKTISTDILVSGNGKIDSTLYGPNELIDKQNQLLDTLSQYADIEVVHNQDHTVKVSFAGKTAVEGEDFVGIVSAVEPNDNTVSITWTDTGKPLDLRSGKLRAFYDFINGNGIHAADTLSPNDTLDKGVKYYQSKIDKFAEVFANAFNNILPVKDENGNNTGEFKQLFVVEDGFTSMNAKSIKINPEWEQRPGYIINDIMVDGKLDNSYVSKMISVFTSEEHNFGEYVGSFEEYVDFYNLGVGEQIKGNSERLKSACEVTESVMDKRDQISGVSQDEEGVNLMIFQKAFQASSRLMTTLDEALDIIINRMGLVGR